MAAVGYVPRGRKSASEEIEREGQRNNHVAHLVDHVPALLLEDGGVFGVHQQLLGAEAVRHGHEGVGRRQLLKLGPHLLYLVPHPRLFLFGREPP